MIHTLTERVSPVKILFSLITALTILLSAPIGKAAAPPSNSPAALGLHPRLFFTASELPGLRDRIATHYQTEFQDFINLLNDTSVLSSGQKAIENHWGSLNYAFIAALDPQEMSQRGFSFDSALDTSQEYCDKAVSYAKTMLGAISAAGGQGHGELRTGYPQNDYFPALATYDWCYSLMTGTDKTDIAGAFVSAYNTKYAGNDVLTMEISGSPMLANNQSTADIFDILGVIAFYGDPYPSAAVQADMYNAFYDIWLDRVMTELNYFYGPATGWHEGPGYFSDGSVNMIVPVGMFSSALGVDYIASTPFFYNLPLFWLGNVKPHTTFSSKCGASGTEICREFQERWGTIGSTAGINCKTSLLASGMLRRANHGNASLARYVREDIDTNSCQGAILPYGGTWAHAVLYWFIYGDRETPPKSPAEVNTPKTLKLGLGEYVMKSGYTHTDSQVIFWAKEHNMYGHESQEYGDFSLHKFGNLILRAANSKSGDAVIDKSKGNIFRNLIGIHKGGSDLQLSFNGDVPDPFFTSRGISKIETAGKLLAEDINNTDYDYIAFDNSASWDPATADISQREFLYLRGPANKEYLVLLDRMNVINPSDKKIWKIWIPAEPVFENGNPTNPRGGKWTSTNSNLISMTNAYSSLETSKYESAPTHGKFFLKTLLPDSFSLNFLGGPGKEFQSGDDDGSTPWGAPSMTQGMHEYLGWGRIEVVPTTAQNYDHFLNVIQFGDSNSLTSPSPAVKIISTSTKMVGADIQDSTGNRVVLFSSAEDGSPVVGDVNYQFKPVLSDTKHLLVNLQPSTTYYISLSTDQVNTTVTVSLNSQSGGNSVASNNKGVLSYTLSGLTVVEPTSPAPPINVTVQ